MFTHEQILKIETTWNFGRYSGDPWMKGRHKPIGVIARLDLRIAEFTIGVDNPNRYCYWHAK